eukprot:TRINITY_DN4599_c0_g1_i1.p1 TRINITY_DN4599_c0_g1~~TRINITY_DN4599_c0_g1_i1.p1  ORF type:complete len:301 (-),score=44.22 TRINITY_DN4599_c0_g1_i1:38-940(-)
MSAFTNKMLPRKITFHREVDSTITPFKGDYLSYKEFKLDPIIKRITALNEEYKSNLNPNSLSELEMGTVIDTIKLLDTKDYLTQFTSKGLLLISEKLLNWPMESIFPVIDIMRVLILFTIPSYYYHQFLERFNANNSVFAKIFRVAYNSRSYPNRLLSLKFITNLFFTPYGRKVVRYHSKVIAEILSEIILELDSYAENQRSSLISIISSITLNFAKLTEIHTKKISEHIKEQIVQLVLMIMDITEDTEELRKCLTSLETIIYFDSRITPNISCLTDYCVHENEQIRKLAEEIIYLLSPE